MHAAMSKSWEPKLCNLDCMIYFYRTPIYPPFQSFIPCINQPTIQENPTLNLVVWFAD